MALIATVGVATFTVSFFAALWLSMCLVGRLTRQTWMYSVGGLLLLLVVVIFAVAPREPSAYPFNPPRLISPSSVWTVIPPRTISSYLSIGQME